MAGGVTARYYLDALHAGIDISKNLDILGAWN
jgi:hypothetical protein